MGRFSRAWSIAAAAATLAWACDRGEAAPVSAPAQSTDATSSQAELALPPAAREDAPAAPPRRAPTPRQKADIEAAVAAPASEHPSLDVLMLAPDLPPRSESKPLELAPPAAAASQPKPAPGALDRLGQNIRLERRKEPIGLSGPRQGTLYETEAGLRIPVDSTVSLEGGVRVDSREEPGVDEPDRRSTPRVGVEVRF